MQQFKKIAQDKLNLNETEALCYELLLIKGKLTAGEICIYAKLDEETDYETIKGILENSEYTLILKNGKRLLSQFLTLSFRKGM